jgi:hypothetical protein
MNDSEKGDGTDTSSQSQIHYERPTGLKGLYSHPVTQVCPVDFVFLNSESEG